MAEGLIMSQLFRRLFSRCRCTQSLSTPRGYMTRSQPRSMDHLWSKRMQKCALKQVNFSLTRSVGSYSRRAEGLPTKHSMAWKQRPDSLIFSSGPDARRYPMTTAEELRHKDKRPRATKMFMRDFIEDSLYNPSYGYFSEQATIFDAGEPFDFGQFRNEAHFYKELGRRYTVFEDELDRETPNETRQLWHTPTELFRPYYAEAIARYMIENYKLIHYPYNDLIIFELGAGNGNFMLSVLDYIRKIDLDVYDRTKYKIIEISSSLANLQAKRLAASAAAHDHASKVEIINESIFSWDSYFPSPCFFLALEVIDNFAHDLIRYDPQTGQPLQGMAVVDEDGEFFQFYSSQLDPLAQRFMQVRNEACLEMPLMHPLRWSKWRRMVRKSLPLAPNLSEPEWIPTRCLRFFEILRDYFPGHQLILSDFLSLPNATHGLNAPVVQTRYRRQTVPVSTPLVCSSLDGD